MFCRAASSRQSRVALSAFSARVVACILLATGVAEPENQRPGLAPVRVVSDEVGFLHALAEWSPSQRFPIFIGETLFLEKFLASYGSESVIYLRPAPPTGPVHRELLTRVLLASWREEGLLEGVDESPSRELLKSRHRELGGNPGMVLSSLTAEELLAGLALASGHIQFFDLLDTSFEGKPSLAVEKDRNEIDLLRSEVQSCFHRWDVSYRDLGDEIDYVTLAMNLPLVYSPGPRSVDDAINRCRLEDRGASFFTGRLVNAAPGMAIYQAMCGLFLSTKRALFFDAWPRVWQRSLRPGYWKIADRIPATLLQGDGANAENWRQLVEERLPADLIYLNSYGDASHWGEATAEDITNPVPCAVLCCHNASAIDLRDEQTIGGRWLRAGAFLYFGAVSDPLVGGCPPPNQVFSALGRGEPIAKALFNRMGMRAEFHDPWRFTLVGDPLFAPTFEAPHDEDNGSRLLRLAVTELKQNQWEEAAEVLHRVTSGSMVEPGILGNLQREFAWMLLDRIYQAIIFEHLEASTVPPRSERLFWEGWWEGEPLAENVIASRLAAQHGKATAAYKAVLARGKLNAYERQMIAERIRSLEKLVRP